MAKKEDKISFKSILNQFMQKSLQSLISVVAEHSDHLVEWIKDISGLRRKIRKLFVAVVFSAAGLGVFGVGVAQYIASLYPSLGNGISYMLVGIVPILIGVLYIKMND